MSTSRIGRGLSCESIIAAICCLAVIGTGITAGVLGGIYVAKPSCAQDDTCRTATMISVPLGLLALAASIMACCWYYRRDSSTEEHQAVDLTKNDKQDLEKGLISPTTQQSDAPHSAVVASSTMRMSAGSN